MLVPPVTNRTRWAPFAGLLSCVAMTTLAIAAPSHAIHPTSPVVLPTAPNLPGTSATLADLVERVSPSVVQILVRQAS